MEKPPLPNATALPTSVADQHGDLAVHGIWALAQAAHGYCEKQRYTLWRFARENHDDAAIAAWHQRFIAASANWLEVSLWVVDYERD